MQESAGRLRAWPARERTDPISNWRFNEMTHTKTSEDVYQSLKAALADALQSQQVADSEVAQVAKQLQAVAPRLTALSENGAAAIDKAAQSEGQIAREIAEALANGSPDKAIQALEVRLVDARRALTTARQAVADDAGLMDALRNKAEMLTAEMEQAENRAAKALARVQGAKAALAMAAWNDAALDLLARYGAPLVQLLSDGGYHETNDLNIPFFSSGGSRVRLGRHDPVELAGRANAQPQGL